VRLVIAPLAALGVLGAAACGEDEASPADPSALEGTPWVLASGCPPPADAVEREYAGALESVRAWRAEGDELILLDGDGDDLLAYRGATPVGSWQATAFLQGDALASLIAGTEITASFAEDGTFSGSAGCNTYRTTYTTDRGGIEIGAPASTKQACAEPEGIMEQEAAFLTALATAARYEVVGPTLSF
jgi:heat shock protein HslJ